MAKFWKIAGVIFGAIVFLAVGVYLFGGTLDRKNAIDSSLYYSGEAEDFGTSDTVGLPKNSRGALPAAPMNDMKLGSGTQEMISDDSGAVDFSDGTADKKIVKNGNLNLKVDNADEAAEEISDIAKSNGGTVFSSNFFQGKDNTKSGTVSVKVPVNNFEKTFSEMKKVASLVLRESVSGTDVTEQYTDLQAQLKNKQTEEQAFTRIMEQAQKIDDILAVQRELSRVRGQIEQLQGRIKYLESQTDMSTITASLTEDANISITDKWRPWQVVKESVSVLVKKIQDFVDFVIKLVILAVPILLLYGILVLVVYRIGKKIYLKVKNRNEGEGK